MSRNTPCYLFGGVNLPLFYHQRLTCLLYVTLPPSQRSFVPKLRPVGSSEHPSDFSFNGQPHPLHQWNPFHFIAGQPCLQANCMSGPSLPDHPHKMTRRPVTRMPRVTTLPPNVTCRRVTHPRADRAQRCLTSERSRASQPHR